ncbi:hypothetical protein BD779DRAFT_1789274 [Infundibulicybe gibba]|nr:hypothetical protein BD779DRAFT_1789274 [Infundibulicybe gibba]
MGQARGKRVCTALRLAIDTSLPYEPSGIEPFKWFELREDEDSQLFVIDRGEEVSTRISHLPFDNPKFNIVNWYKKLLNKRENVRRRRERPGTPLYDYQFGDVLGDKLSQTLEELAKATRESPRGINIIYASSSMDGPVQPQVAHDRAQANLGSPIINLNADVLREIFLFCLFGDPACIPLVNPTVRLEPRLVLSHVCTSWRVLALNTPELWSYIVVGWLKRPRHYECLKTWLDRSTQAPLSIHGIITHSLKGIDGFDSIVLSNIHRCQRLTMKVTPTLLPTLLRLPPGSLQVLVSVNLHFSVRGFGRELRRLAVDTPITSFQMAPQLRCVTLESMCDWSAVDLQCFHFPWSQLTTLTLQGMELAADSCIAILHACAALESCRVSIAPINDLAIKEIQAHVAPAIVLPALHTLHFSGNLLHATFLAAFHLPNLRSLELDGDNIEWWSIGILTPILAPTAHTLKVLRIGKAPFYTDQDVRALLELLPHLTECVVKTAMHWKSGTLNAVRDGECGIRLKTLSVSGLGVGELLDIAEGRLRAARESAGAISVITVVRGICCSPRRKNPATARLQALRSAGVQIYFDLFSLSDVEVSDSDLEGNS